MRIWGENALNLLSEMLVRGRTMEDMCRTFSTSEDRVRHNCRHLGEEGPRPTRMVAGRLKVLAPRGIWYSPLDQRRGQY